MTLMTKQQAKDLLLKTYREKLKENGVEENKLFKNGDIFLTQGFECGWDASEKINQEVMDKLLPGYSIRIAIAGLSTGLIMGAIIAGALIR